MLRKILLLLSGNATASLLSLIRNLLVARLLSVENYGIAATFAVVMAMIEMATALGLQARIVQNRDGDNPAFQAGLQGFQVLRGAVSAGVLFFVAPYIADFMNVPEMTWAYQLLALAPLIGGFAHFDMHRFNREMRFGPLLMVNIAPTAITLAMVWPLILWLEDWRVMLVIVIFQVVIKAVASHVVAQRRYQLRFRLAEMRDSFQFGWPLMINNVLLFLTMQGDKALVMREMGAEALAIFALGVTLTLTPTLVMAKSVRALFLPGLSAECAPDEFRRRVLLAMHGAILNGAILILAVFFLGELVVMGVLGEKYAALVPLLGAFAAVQAMRVLKTGSNVVALSQAQTANAMVSNVFRVLTLPLILIALQQGAGFKTLLLIAFGGEVVGYAVSVFLVWRSVERRLSPIAPPLVVLVLLMGLTALAPSYGITGALGQPLWVWVLGLFGGLVVSMSSLRAWVLRRIPGVRVR